MMNYLCYGPGRNKGCFITVHMPRAVTKQWPDRNEGAVFIHRAVAKQCTGRNEEPMALEIIVSCSKKIELFDIRGART